MLRKMILPSVGCLHYFDMIKEWLKAHTTLSVCVCVCVCISVCNATMLVALQLIDIISEPWAKRSPGARWKAGLTEGWAVLSTVSALGGIRWENNRERVLCLLRYSGEHNIWDAEELEETEWSVPESWQLSRPSSQSLQENKEKQFWWWRKILE